MKTLSNEATTARAKPSKSRAKLSRGDDTANGKLSPLEDTSKARLTAAQAAWDSEKSVAIRRAISIVRIAVQTLESYDLSDFKGAREEEKAIEQAIEEMRDTLEEVLLPCLPLDPLGVEAFAGLDE